MNETMLPLEPGMNEAMLPLKPYKPDFPKKHSLLTHCAIKYFFIS